MATFKQNNIQFTADNSTLDIDGQRYTKFGNRGNGTFSEIILNRNGGVKPFVNAVEIDWNSAIIGEG